MKKLFFGITLIFCAFTQAQQLSNRYVSEINNNVQVVQNVIFSTNIPSVKTTNLFGNQIANEESYGQVQATLKMDIYKPSNDTLSKKPVIIFAFGGGFVNGERTEKSMVQLCQAFAKRGFVTATIDYRLGMNINNEELAKRAVYRAVQDGRSAVRFFRKNASNYGIDPDQIYLSGHSAGSFIAYHNIYLDKDSERPASTRKYMNTRPDLGGLDEVGDNKTYADGSLVIGKANGVMGFAGAIADLNYIEGKTDIPAVYFHSSDDNVVPYNSGEPFSFISWLPGFNLPTVFGGNQMNNKANMINAFHTFYSYTSRGHQVHYDGSNLYSDVGIRGGQFFYDNKLKPNTVTISGNNNVCANCPPQTYSVPKSAFYYDWQVTGGVFTTKSVYSNTANVKWNPNVATHSVSVTPYSRQLAKGKINNLDITINQSPALRQSFDGVTSSSKIDLNDYFNDPEGQPLTYKITNSDDAVLKINASESFDNILSLNSLKEGISNITIEVNDGSDCSTVHTFEIKNEIIFSDFLKAIISPNPFTDKTSLDLDGTYEGNIKILIYNELGSILSEKNINKTADKKSFEIDMEMKSKGIYYVKIIANDKVAVKRILKN